MRKYIEGEYKMSREYRENFNQFFRLLDRETRKWGDAYLNWQDYEPPYRTAAAIFNRGWNLNDGELWLSPFLWRVLSSVNNVHTDSGWRFDFSGLGELLEERWTELTDDDPETSDVDYRFGGWIRTTCDYE